MMNTIYLLLGSNIGDSRHHLDTAISFIRSRVGTLVQQSSIYKTEPWGNKEQQDFLNQVLEVHTLLEPEEVLHQLLMIEQEMGRERMEKWGPRVIDIDILFYENRVIHSQRLTIPHPLLHERRFTLLPLAELAPNLIHPVILKSVKQLLDECLDSSLVLRYE
jgi:2-amino-4-hydroxy-6-hydroxymethyldihydropteridine diphosphokinase